MAFSVSFSSFSTLLSLFLLFTFTSSSASNSQLSSLTITSKQLKFWLSNVNNEMPQAILSKLSPLTERDSGALSSLFSNEQVSPFSSSTLCSLSNLACSANLNAAKPVAQGHQNTYQNDRVKLSSHFFRLAILKNGNTVRLPDLHDIYPSRSFLPSQIASKISIDSIGLKRAFPESFVSPITKEAIQMTIFRCNAPSMKGEIQRCPRSLEEMIDFSKNVLGGNKLVALTPTSVEGSGKELIIGSIKQYDSKKVVSCHEFFLPFSTYFCHSILSSRLYAVDLFEPHTNVKVNTGVAICHMDTSAWHKEHLAFKLLNISPGKGEVCHWFSQMDLAWVTA